MKSIKKLLIILLSLPIILGGNNFCYAVGNEVSIDETNVAFSFETSATGLKVNDEVKVKIKVQFNKEGTTSDDTTKINAITARIDYDNTKLTPISPNNNSNYISADDSPFTSSNGSIQDYESIKAIKYDWGNITGYNTINLGTKITLCTITFKLKSEQTPPTSLDFKINLGSNSLSEPYTEFSNYDGANDTKILAGLPEQATANFTHTFAACTHPGKDFANWETVKSPTCTEKGTKTWTCPECGEEINVDIDPLEHSFKWTAIDDNQHQEKCERESCDETNGAPEDHTWKSYEPIDDSQHKKTCSECGHPVNEPHNFPEEWTPDNNATCTQKGTKHKECPNCHKTIYEDNAEDPAKGHDMGEWETTKEATCTEQGTQTRKCKRTGCDYSETQTLDALGHDYGTQVVAPTETTLGGTKHRCYRCGNEYWTDFTKDDKYAQITMPNGETVYHYCTHNGLATETTVDIGDGQTLRVFLQDPLGVLKKNDTDDLGMVVTYIKEGSARYDELKNQVDDTHPIEHIKFFNVYPTVNGKPVTGALDGSIYMEYEIPEGWDEEDLEMILVQDGDDQEFDETVLDIDGKRYLAMWKNHFSPYAMIDKLSEEEQAALKVDELNDEEKAQLNTALENLSDEDMAQLKKEVDSSSNQVKTGDETGYIVLMSSSMALIAGLYLELCMKKKRN